MADSGCTAGTVAAGAREAVDARWPAATRPADGSSRDGFSYRSHTCPRLRFQPCAAICFVSEVMKTTVTMAPTGHTLAAIQRHARGLRTARPRAWRLGLTAVSCSIALGSGAASAAPIGGEQLTPTFDCSSVTFTYTGFPSATGVSVHEWITLEGQSIYEGDFSFVGPSGSNTVSVTLPPGHHALDARARWKVNGVFGDADRKLVGGLTCAAQPGFTIHKLQSVAGSAQAPTANPITAEVAQTLDYQIILSNTGNVPLALERFSDPGCDAGTISGGPGASALAVAGTVAYECRHTLTTADQLAGVYRNTATAAGRPSGGGGAITETSNTVVAYLAAGSNSSQPPSQPTPSDVASADSNDLAASVAGPAPATAVLGSTTRSGTLAAIAVVPPQLHGPGGCATPSYRVSLASAGVRSVTFYLDGHKLKALTSRDARGGRFAISIDTRGLTVGKHLVRARIAMAESAAGSTAQLHTASRSLTLLRCASATRVPRFTG